MHNQYIKIYGERNTGTNYLDKLMDLNFYVESVPGVVPRGLDKILRRLPCSENIRDSYFQLTKYKNLGWKHRELDEGILSVVETKKDHVKIIALVKNPYSWLLSLYKRPYHYRGMAEENFGTFATKTWETLGRESLRPKYRDPVEMWNKKVSSYLYLQKKSDCTILRYEDLLQNPEVQLEYLRDSFGLAVRPDYPSNYVRPAKSSDMGKAENYYLDYYGNEKWKKYLTENDLALVNDRLDRSLMQKLGYEAL